MNEYILQYPIQGKVYNSNDPKKAAKRAFLDIYKLKNTNQSRIKIIENNSKKEYNFIAMTDNKLNEYNKLLNSRNPIQAGGANGINDREFYDKLTDISGDINLSVGELTKMLKQKFEPDDDVIFLIKDGINKLDSINKGVEKISNTLEEREKSQVVTKQKNLINLSKNIPIVKTTNLYDSQALTEDMQVLSKQPEQKKDDEEKNNDVEQEEKEEENQKGRGCVIM